MLQSRAFVVLIAGLLMLGMPLQVRAQTLADALAGAYENSGLVAQNRALLRAADEDVAQAVSVLRPIMDWSADVTRSFSRSRSSAAGRTFDTSATNLNLGLTGSLLLYDFGRSRLTAEAAKETVLATRQTLISVEQQVLLRAVQAYMNVIRNQEFVALRKNNLRLLQEELRAARDRFEVGEVTRTDVSQAESAVAATQSGLAAAQGDLARAREEYRTAVGTMPDRLQPPASQPRIDDSVEDARRLALQRHPDLLRAQHDVAAADLNVQAAAAAVKPQINLTGRLGVTDELGAADFNRQGSVGIELRGPVTRGGRLNSATRRAMAQRDAQRAALHLAGLRVSQDVGNAYANLRAARAGRAASREQVRAATLAFESIREEARLGARTTLDVLDTEQDLLDARANLISANADVVIARYAVVSAMGELTARDLRLAVQTYDPGAYYDLVKDAPTALSPQGRKLDKVLRALGKE